MSFFFFFCHFRCEFHKTPEAARTRLDSLEGVQTAQYATFMKSVGLEGKMSVCLFVFACLHTGCAAARRADLLGIFTSNIAAGDAR